MISGLLHIILSIRNLFYDKGWFKSYSFQKPKTLVVGNLSLGGAGKSPLVQYLINNWQLPGKLAILSRGYGRKTKGFRQVTQQETAATVGDEPMTYHLSFPKIPIFVGEDRVAAIQQIKKLDSSIDFILMDDGFQHRSLKAHLNLICTPYQKLFYEDSLWPQGTLREPRAGISRADLILVTKCPPEITEKEKATIVEKIHQYHRQVPVYFSVNQYGNPSKGLFSDYIAFAGIASPDLFFEKISQLGNLSERIQFKDHHAFSKNELGRLENLAANLPANTGLITTYKDYVRLIPYFEEYQNLGKYLGYLPHSFEILDSQHFWLDLNKLLD